MASSPPLVVIVGSCLIDFVSYAPRFAKAGETIAARKFVTNFGGKGGNQCIAAARLGVQTAIVARLGDDVWGKRYIDNLKKEGVKVDHIKTVPESETGVAQITVSDEGDSRIVIIPGANADMTVQDVTEASSIISTASVLVLQLETPQQATIEAMKLCKSTIILNGAPATTEYDPNLLKMPSIFIVNETEAETFAGMQITTVGEAETAASKLVSLGCQSVIITLGEHGCIYHNNKNEKFRVTSPQVECVDSTGAGDAFIGALAYMLAVKTDLPLKLAVQYACAIAADCVTRPGTQPSYPDKTILSHLNIH